MKGEKLYHPKPTFFQLNWFLQGEIYKTMQSYQIPENKTHPFLYLIDSHTAENN